MRLENMDDDLNKKMGLPVSCGLAGAANRTYGETAYGWSMRKLTWTTWVLRSPMFQFAMTGPNPGCLGGEAARLDRGRCAAATRALTKKAKMQERSGRRQAVPTVQCGR